MSIGKVSSRVNRLFGASVIAVGIGLLATGTQAQAQAQTAAPDASEPAVAGVADILVTGRRSLNTDIRRSEDDIQPYVVFDAEELVRSGAQNVEDFLKSRLPMNAAQVTRSQAGPPTSAAGRLDLRGLGADETLVLIDGRRLPSVSTGDSFGQPNINGISIAQIERIEVLPSTAGGIYGGGATGGVINIILKRSYSGLSLEARYDDSFDLAAGQSYLGINGGLTFDKGRTRIMGSFSRSRASTLLSSERDFFRRGAELQFRNDPINSTVLLGGQNICSTVDGFDCASDTLTLKAGGSLDSAFTSVPDGSSGDGAGLAARAGTLIYDRSDLPIWTAPDVTTYNFNIRREFGSNLELYADFSRDETTSENITPAQYSLYVPGIAAANPFNQDVLAFVSFPDALRQWQESNNTRVNAGAIIRLPGQWSASLEYGWLRNKGSSISNVVLGPASAEAEETLQAAAFTDLRANPLSDPASLFQLFTSEGDSGTTLEIASLRLGGPILALPGGHLTATTLLEGRRETSDSEVITNTIGGFPLYSWSPEARREVKSGYFELTAPVIGAANDVSFVHELQLMGSVRYDEYETTYAGSSISIDSATGPFPEVDASLSNLHSTNYTLGIKYAPSADIAFRASWGNGFLPPKLGNIRSEPPSVLSDFLIFLLNLRDPGRNDELIPGPVAILGGGTPNLRPEDSESFSAGVVLTPTVVPGLRMSADLTSIKKTDEVLNLPVTFFLANQAAFADRIVRGDPLPGDAPGIPGPITSINASAINLASSKLKAIDFKADYSFENERLGDFRVYGVATHTIELSLRSLPGEPPVDRAGSFDGPLKWRANVGFDWEQGSWSGGWNTQIYGSYRVCESVLTEFTCAQEETWQGGTRIKAQTYSDIYVGYSFDEGPLMGAEVKIGIQNLFDQKPPVVASGIDQMGYSSFADPRLQRFTLTLRKQF